MIDKTKEIDERWNELKKRSKNELWNIFGRTHKVFSKDKGFTKMDIMNDIIESEIGWKHYSS